MGIHQSISAASLWSTPHWFPYQLDPDYDRLLLVERSEEAFRAGADPRSFGKDAARQVVAWSQVASSMPAAARRDVQYLFHIGHVGAASIARLLGALPQVLALREPPLLRTHVEQLRLNGRPDCAWPPASIPARLETLTALLSRTFRADQRALATAASDIAEFAPVLVPAGSKAVLLYSGPAAYAAAALATDATRAELHRLAPSRVERLNRRFGEPRWKLWELNEAGKAGLAWACEMTALRRAADSLPAGGGPWLEFDRFLADPVDGLVELAAFVGADLSPARAEPLCAALLSAHGPDSPELRAQMLAQSRRDNRDAIRAAMQWLAGAASVDPMLAEMFDGSEDQ